MLMDYRTTKVLSKHRYGAMRRGFTPSPRKSPEIPSPPAPHVRLRPVPAG